MNYTLNCHGRLVDLSVPQVMGILNLTPDSFFAGSRKQTEAEIIARGRQILDEGGTMIDVGACSTRPGGAVAPPEVEMERMRRGLSVLRRELPDAVLSIDTFRPEVARMAVEEYGTDLLNDVSEGDLMEEAAALRVPYILMSVQPTLRETLLVFAEKVERLRELGQKDIILDPGFGFGKTLEQNFRLLAGMEKLQVMGLPLLVGVSRKRMIWMTLGTSPEEALNGTTVLNTVALLKGASILRVHDVKQAYETIRLCSNLE